MSRTSKAASRLAGSPPPLAHDEPPHPYPDAR